MRWWSRVYNVLKIEPETWLAYLYGQRYKELKHLQDAEPRFRGGVLRFSIYIYTLILRVSLRKSPRLHPVKFLIYAGSENQMNALQSTIDYLKAEGLSFVVLMPKFLTSKYVNNCKVYQVVPFGICEMFRTLTLTLARLPAIIKAVRKINIELFNKHLDIFLESHVHLVCFDRLLSNIRPEYVIVSNDHSVPNRSLLSLARSSGCKTVYMQHASVSKIFPALNVNYAFLDGRSAYETYLMCESNHSQNDSLLKHRQVILSGQKKILFDAAGTVKSGTIGLAVNALDKIKDLELFVKQVNNEGYKIKLRWHPALGEKKVETLVTLLGKYQIEFSNPKVENLNKFLFGVDALVAGNSSIHLEAALSSVPTFYFEFSTTDNPDYYGYVKNGLAIQADDIKKLVRMFEKTMKGEIQINIGAVRFYSSTFRTEWEGKEGELVVGVLLDDNQGFVKKIAL